MNTTIIGSGKTFSSIQDAKEWNKEICEQQEQKCAVEGFIDDVFEKVSAGLTDEEQNNASKICTRTKQGEVEEITFRRGSVDVVQTTVTDPGSKKLKSVEVKETKPGNYGRTEDIYSMSVVDGSFMGHMGGLFCSIARFMLRPPVALLTLGSCGLSDVPIHTPMHPEMKYSHVKNYKERVASVGDYYTYIEYSTANRSRESTAYVNRENASTYYVEVKDGRFDWDTKISMNPDDHAKQLCRETGWNIASV